MRISEIAAETGLSIDTIRYYEKAGICPPISRSADGRRLFSNENCEWLTLLASLRETGMPLKEMSEFGQLYQRGDATVAQRKAMLIAHGQRLERRRAALARCDALLQFKIGRYDEILGEQA
ncbi:MAG: MerR family transcriptional regulator [Sulfitobacter sp.]